MEFVFFSVIFRIPSIAYAQKMREKSVGMVLSVDLQDPSTTRGVTEVMKGYLNVVPIVSPCGNVRKKTVIHGILHLRNTIHNNILRRSGIC